MRQFKVGDRVAAVDSKILGTVTEVTTSTVTVKWDLNQMGIGVYPTVHPYLKLAPLTTYKVGDRVCRTAVNLFPAYCNPVAGDRGIVIGTVTGVIVEWDRLTMHSCYHTDGTPEIELMTTTLQEQLATAEAEVTRLKQEIRDAEPFKADLALEFGVFVGRNQETATHSRKPIAIFDWRSPAVRWAETPSNFPGRYVVRQRMDGKWGPVLKSEVS